MATEVTVCVRGVSCKQALFVAASEWDLPLAEFRAIIGKHDIPADFKFLTLKGNVISKILEETILVKEVVGKGKASSNSRSRSKSRSNYYNANSDINEENLCSSEMDSDDSQCNDLEMWLISCSGNSGSNSFVEQGKKNIDLDLVNNVNVGDNCVNESNDVDDQSAFEHGERESRDQRRDQSTGCPWKHFVQNFQQHVNVRSLFKMLLILTVILAALMACLTFTIHMMLGTLTSFSAAPGLNDVFSSLKGRSYDESDAIANMQVKLKEMEMASKYEIQELRTKLAELEDLYLRDLDVHKKELLLLKHQHLKIEDAYSGNEKVLGNARSDASQSKMDSEMRRKTKEKMTENDQYLKEKMEKTDL